MALFQRDIMFWKFLKKAPQEAPSHASPSPREPATQVPIAFLQRLIPIGELPIETLLSLDIQLGDFTPGQIIFNRGEQADALIYLYEGEVFLESVKGSGYPVSESTFQACYPLSTSKQHSLSAIAKTAVRVIYLPLALLQQQTPSKPSNPLLEPASIPKGLWGSDFFQQFCTAFNKERLHIPTLPDIALRLRSALQKDIGISEAAKIVNLDPVIASKIIQVVNSPLYRTEAPIANCHDAINRLGLKTTQNLVTSISLHNLFKCHTKALNERTQNLWRQSVYVACLSHTLAKLSKRINPDEALLAGLTHNIGAMPIVTFADSLGNEHFNLQELDETIANLQGNLGGIILKSWGFPDELQSVPEQSSHWYRTGGEKLDIADIVILARFHSLIGTPQKQRLPPISTLPAFHKLGETELTPDMSLQALQDAKQQIADALNFFRN